MRIEDLAKYPVELAVATEIYEREFEAHKVVIDNAHAMEFIYWFIRGATPGFEGPVDEAIVSEANMAFLMGEAFYRGRKYEQCLDRPHKERPERSP